MAASSETSTCSGLASSSEDASQSSGEAVEMEIKSDLTAQNVPSSSDCDQEESRQTGAGVALEPDHPPGVNKHRDNRLIMTACIAIVILLIIVGLLLFGCAFYVWHLQVQVGRANYRIDQLEREKNHSYTGPTVNSTGPQEENVVEVFRRLSQLRDEVRENISFLSEAVIQMQRTHASDIDEVKKNASNLQGQLSKFLNESLSVLSNETRSIITLLNASVAREVHMLEGRSLAVQMNVSALTDHVTTLQNRLQELEHNTTLLEETLSEKLDAAKKEYRTEITSLAGNVSTTLERVDELHRTQLEHRAVTEETRSNVSLLKHDLEVLTEAVANHTTALTEIETGLTRMNASLRAELERQSERQEDLYSSLNMTREEINSIDVALKDSIASLDSNVAEKLLNLTVVQQDVREDLSSFEQRLAENTTTLNQLIASLNESIFGVGEELQTISEGQRDLELELNVTKGTFVSNLSSVEREIRGEIDSIHENLQGNISSLGSELRLELAEMKNLFEGNVSVLTENLTRTNVNLSATSAQLLNLSSLYGDFHAHYLITNESIFAHRASISRDVFQLFDLVHSVDRNHTLLIEGHSAVLRGVESNVSILTQQLHNVLESQGAQDRKITNIESSFGDRLRGVREALSLRIDEQSRRIHSAERRIDRVEQTLSGASSVSPLPLMVFSITSLLILCT